MTIRAQVGSDRWTEEFHQSGRGLPHSKTWRRHGRGPGRAKLPAAFACVILCSLFCGFFSANTCDAAAPTVYERRVINNYQVDLMPLFVWWDHREHQQGVRPLTSWKHLQGALESETMYGWRVRGTIEGQPGLQYFLLKNPPKKELAKYRELEAQLPKLEQAKANALPNTKLAAYSGWTFDAAGAAIRAPTEDFDRIEQAKNEVSEIDGQIQATRQEMAEMLTKRGYFKVDVFALQMSQVYQGNPVFDFGYPPY